MLQYTWEWSLFNLVFFFSLDKYPKVELLDHKIINYILKYLVNLHAAFQSGWINLHSHQRCISSLSFTSSPTLIFLVFFIIVIITSMRWYLSVIVICIFLMLSIFSFICWPSLEKQVFRSSTDFNWNIWCFLVVIAIEFCECFVNFGY